MKKLLIATSDKLVLDILVPLLEDNRLFLYRIVKDFEQFKKVLVDEKDLFLAIIDPRLSNQDGIEIVKETLLNHLPLLVLIDNFQDKYYKQIKNLKIIDFIHKENIEDITRIVTLAEDLNYYNKKKVLILHSNRTVRFFLSNFFSELLFKPEVADSFEDALALLHSDVDYEIMLVNYEHPGIKGSEFIKHVRQDKTIKEHQNNDNIVIFGVTSSESDEIRSEFLKKGANDIIRIPFTKGEVLSKISNILALSIKTKELSTHIDTIDQYVISTKTDIYGNITYVSKAFEKISGYIKEELIDKPHSSVKSPDFDSTIFKDMWKTIKSGQAWHGEIKNLSKDGHIFWVKSNITPEYQGNTLLGYTSISEDITAQKELEVLSRDLEHRITEALEENEKQSKQMVQQSRLAQMGEMISMIAHQWRQPLTSITSLAGTLMINVELENYDALVFQKNLASIEEISQHLSETINDFRRFFDDNKIQSEFIL